MLKNLKIENSLKIKNCKLKIAVSICLFAYLLILALTYANNTKSEINLVLSVQDFTELEDSYKIDFLTGKDSANYKYSLSSWISFENKNLDLAPGEKKSVKVFIDKNRITKGGHYASILPKSRRRKINSK